MNTKRGSTYEDEGTLLLTYADRRDRFELQMIDPPNGLIAMLLNADQAELLRAELGDWLDRNPPRLS